MERLVLFDIDKTLIKNSTLDMTAFFEAVKKVYGIDAKHDSKEQSGMTDQERLFYVLRKSGLDEKTIKKSLNECFNVFTELFKKTINEKEILVLDGIIDLLNGLEKNHILVGLVTGNIEATARYKLEKVNLNKYFKFGGFGNDEIKRYNLIKIAIKRAEEKFGFKFNNNVFLVGDTPRDVKAGKEAEVKIIGVATGIWSEGQLKEAGADFVFRNLRETDEIMKVILEKV